MTIFKKNDKMLISKQHERIYVVKIKKCMRWRSVKKRRFLKALFVTTALFGLTASAENVNLINNGSFSNGENGFGICYSSRQDTSMPSLSVSKSIFKDGGTLEFIPGADLDEKPSSSVSSKGFAYQGVFHKNTVSVKENVKYNISADVYSKSESAKMRFVIMSGTKAIAASEEMDLAHAAWGKNVYKWVPDADMDNIRIRMVFYDIEQGKSIYVDNFSCSESILTNTGWMPENSEDIQKYGTGVLFKTSSNTESGIYRTVSSLSFEKDSKYAITATASTNAEKAYLSLICGSKSENYVIKNGEKIKIVLPFTADGNDVKIVVRALTAAADEIILDDISIAGEEDFINVETNNQQIVISGKLREGNENKEITVSLGTIGTINTTTDANGVYSVTYDIPEMSGPNMLLNIVIGGIRGYIDNGGEIRVDYIVNNPEYADEIAKKVSGATKEIIKSELTDEILENLGAAMMPVVRSADKEDIFEFLAGKQISAGDELMNNITIGAALSSLENRTQSFTDMTDSYSGLLSAGSSTAYKNIYAGADKTKLNELFNGNKTEIKDVASYQYVLAETLVKYEMQSMDTYSQQMSLLKKYSNELGLDFSEYDKLSPSSKQYDVATALTKGLKNENDYSTLQAKLDALVREAESKGNGSSGGSGGGSSSGGSKNNSGNGLTVSYSSPKPGQPEEYHFGDLAGYEWAKDAIYELVKDNVISKPDNKLYNPSDNVTRAELAKMVAVLFGYEEYSGAEQIFKDVNTDDWYYKYVMALYKNGIIKGISEDEFGSNATVTRQDICVIIARTLKQTVGEPDVSFSDIDLAAEYAKESIKLMKKLGIINGYEDGSFKPMNYASRAEMAQILYKIKNMSN